MFGYVRPALDQLEQGDTDLYRAAYCGLCHTLGARYGLTARLFLNYDLTFLLMLLERSCSAQERRCMIHPIRKRSCLCRSGTVDTVADYSVILLWWQLQDNIADHGVWRSLKYRLAAMCLRRSYQKARKLCPAFDAHARRQLERLHRLEAEKCDSIDRPADCFAALLAGAAAAEDEPVRRRVLEQLLYHLGRWIYLVDAADDLKKDLKSGCYNPLLLQYPHTDGELSADSRQALGQTLDASIRQMAAAFELADFGENTAVVQNIVYEELYLVGAAVLNGTYHRRPKRKLKNPTGER